MRSAGTIRDKLHARRFADFLLTRGITTRMDSGAEGFTVWVQDDDRLAEVREELPRFIAAPADPRYDVSREAEAQNAATRKTAEAAQVVVRRVPVSSVPAAARVGFMGTPLALALVAFCVVVAVYTQLGESESRLARLTIATVQRLDVARIDWHGLEDVHNGEVWRLLTP